MVQRSSLRMGSGRVPALCSSSRQRPRRWPSTDQEQLDSGPSTPNSSSGMPSSRDMPSRSAAPWLTTTASPSCRPARGRSSRERGGDAVQRARHPVGDHGGRLAVGRVPGGVLGRVAGADLRVGQPFPAAAVPLAQVLVEDHLEPGQPGQRGGGARRAAQVGGDDHVRAQPGQQPGGPLGLGLPGRVERDVALPLEAPLGVPRRLAVPPQHQPDRVAQRVLPGLTTSSGSGIGGQSFQIRSSE